MAARERHRQRLLDLKAEILAEGDIDLPPGRQDVTAVGSDEDAQPLTEMSQAIASSRNRNRSAVLARVVAVFAEPGVEIATLAAPFTTDAEWRNPSVVKVVCEANGTALYFFYDEQQVWDQTFQPIYQS